MMLRFIALLFFSISVFANNIVSGSVALIAVNSPKVYWGTQRVMVRKYNNSWQAIVGVPMYRKKLVLNVGNKNIILPIKQKKYPAQYIKLKYNKMVTPNHKNLLRIKREGKILQNLFQYWRYKSKVNLCFRMPVQGRISGKFGLTRYFNGKRRGYHKGLDIAAPLGRFIRAPASAKVLNTGSYFFTGKTVFLDHGDGLISLYAHLSKVLVHQGESVKRGQIIGRIGKTGRATGPHLHWGVSLNNVRIDPMVLVRCRLAR